MPTVTPHPLPFLDLVEAAGRLDESEAARALRAAGREAYRREGWPHAKVEAWKYTNLNRLAAVPFAAATADGGRSAMPASASTIAGALRLVTVDGVFRPELSDSLAGLAGIEVAGSQTVAERWGGAALGRLLALDRMPIAALNAAAWRGGVAIRIADGAAVAPLLHLVRLSTTADTPVMSAPRDLILVGRGARLGVVETWMGAGAAPRFTNQVAEIAIDEGGSLDLARLVAESPDAFLIATSGVRLAARARFAAFALTVGGQLVRNECQVTLAGPGAEAQVHGAYLADGDAQVDNTTLVDHAAPGAVSRQAFRGVLGGTARGIFQGKVIVRPQAQKTDGHQIHKALLLSPGAEVDAKPELEIYADDVKCGHGATVGHLDQDALFYLRARGIREPDARRMLVEAFLGEALEIIADGRVRAACTGALEARLAAIAGETGGAR